MNIAIGGLMRCCIETIKRRDGEFPEGENARIKCDYCPSHLMREGGTWRWERKEDEDGTE